MYATIRFTGDYCGETVRYTCKVTAERDTRNAWWKEPEIRDVELVEIGDEGRCGKFDPCEEIDAENYWRKRAKDSQAVDTSVDELICAAMENVYRKNPQVAA